MMTMAFDWKVIENFVLYLKNIERNTIISIRIDDSVINDCMEKKPPCLKITAVM
jgi:hypothetical protein